MSIEQEQSANSFNYNPNPKSNICILFANCWHFAVYLVNIRISVIRISRIVWKNGIRIRLFNIRIRFGNSSSNTPCTIVLCTSREYVLRENGCSLKLFYEVFYNSVCSHFNDEFQFQECSDWCSLPFRESVDLIFSLHCSLSGHDGVCK